MTAPASTPSSPGRSRLGGAQLLVALLSLACAVLAWHLYRKHAAEAPAASPADATLADGRAVPASWPAGAILGLHAPHAEAGSARWEIRPEAVAQGAMRPSDGRDVFVTMPASGPVTFRLDVAAGSRLASKTFTVAAGSDPAPAPGPTPGPAPTPPPAPVDGPVDDRLRSLAADYYRSAPDDYLAVVAKIAAADPDYNAITQPIVDHHAALAKALGEYIDGLTAPLRDDKLRFKDKAEAKRVYALIGNSLKAGRADAAR